jgi:hypothetical protein
MASPHQMNSYPLPGYPLPSAAENVQNGADAQEAGKRFALLVAGIVVIFFVAENFQKIKAIPKHVKPDKRTVAAWATFLILLYAGYIYQPEAEDPSVTITFGAGIQLFSMLLLYVMPRQTDAPIGTRTGDSAEFALLLALSMGLRLSSTCRFLGYLPTDATGDGCYQAMEALSMVLAFRGLLAMGLAPKQGMKCVASVAASMVLAVFCYGDLDRRPFWDRVYATSNYVEFAAYAFMSLSLLSAGSERTVPRQFLLPSMAQGYMRAGFWYLAMDEMIPQRPTKLMEYFPTVLVIVMGVSAVQQTLVAMLIVCKPEGPLLPQTAEVKKSAEPFMEFVSSVLGADGPASVAPPGLVPVRAVYEDGKLRVEYGPAASNA